MFGKRKRQKTFYLALSEMPRASSEVSEKWIMFCETLKFREEVPLAEQVRLFSISLAGFFHAHYPNISKTDPSVYLAALLIGIYLAKTHPIPLVLDVATQIEKELGVSGLEALVRKFVQNTPNY